MLAAVPMNRLVVMLLAVLLALIPIRPHGTVPAGFTAALVTALGSPTAIAFTPDGRMLVTTQTGTLRVYASSALVATPAITFPGTALCTNSERGLLGIAVDPSFAS